MGGLSSGDNPFGKNLFSGVILIIMTALLTYAIGNSQDRYRASEAERDLKKIRLEITLVEARSRMAVKESETRMKELLIEHKTGGPHDDVSSELLKGRIERELNSRFISEIRNDLKDIKGLIKEITNGTDR